MDAISPKERRIVSRQPTNTLDSVLLHFDSMQPDIVTKIEDISIAGMGIRAPRHMEAGTLMVLEPARSSRRFAPELKAEVRHSVQCDNEDYLIGCRFSRYLTADDTMALG
jgi:hypothetical protein